jgi:adenylate cyclase
LLEFELAHAAAGQAVIWNFGTLAIDGDRREIRRDGKAVDVEPRTLDLLLYLIRHRDRAVSKDELQDQVWGTIVSDAALVRGVMKARKVLGDSTEDPRYLETVRGHGYRFVGAPQEVVLASAPDKRRSRRSIAVLPFANMTGDPANQYFSDGVAEEILNLLARIPDLRVSSRTSSFCFRDSTLDLRSIAAKLGVGFVLEGSLRRDRSRVRITVQLIDAGEDAHVLSEVFERELTDIFRLQTDIATEVVAKLQLATASLQRAAPDTANLQAYEFYLRGRHYFHLYDGPSLDYARLMYRKAIELDPEFAKAWAGLAETLTFAWMWKDSNDALLAEATQASLRAVELAPELAESRCARGFVLSLQGDYAAAAAEFDAAIERDSMLYEAWYLYGRSRFAEGEMEAAAQLFSTAAAVRPDEYQASTLAVLALQQGGDRDRQLAAAEKAVRRCRLRLDLQPDDTRALTLGAGSLLALGQTAEAVDWAERAIALRPDDIGVLHNAGCALCSAGEIDRALDVFEKRFRLGTAYADWIANDPDFDPIRDHPRFKAMLRTGPRADDVT